MLQAVLFFLVLCCFAIVFPVFAISVTCGAPRYTCPRLVQAPASVAVIAT